MTSDPDVALTPDPTPDPAAEPTPGPAPPPGAAPTPHPSVALADPDPRDLDDALPHTGGPPTVLALVMLAAAGGVLVLRSHGDH